MARADRPKRPAQGAKEAELEFLRREVQRLQAQVTELQSELVERALSQVEEGPDEALLRQVAAALAQLATEWDEGQVPLPALRRAVAAPREALDQALLGLERQGRLSLLAVRDERLVCGCGLRQEERGLLYWARPRDPR